MIVDGIISGIAAIIKFLFGWIQLPQAPIELTAPVDFILNTINFGITLLAYIYTPVLFVILVGCAIAVLAFDQIYFFTMWVIRKLPLNIR